MTNAYVDIIKSIAIPNKYTKWYCKIVTKPFGETTDYTEKHHILPKSFSMGGETQPENIVELPARHHFIAHACLSKMFTGVLKNKMVFAFFQMRAKNKYQTDRYTNSRLYLYAKVNKTLYNIFYRDTQCKYIDKTDRSLIEKMISEGWSEIMPESYKLGHVGNMKGKKHSEETKQKMRKPHPHYIPLKRSGEEYQKIAAKSLETTKIRDEKDPSRIVERQRKMSDALKKLYREGKMSSSGEKNGMYGKPQKESTRKIIGEKNRLYQQRIKSDLVYMKEYSRMRSRNNLQRYKDDPSIKIRIRESSIKSRHGGMTYEEIYSRFIRPNFTRGESYKTIANKKYYDCSFGTIVKISRECETLEDRNLHDVERKKLGLQKTPNIKTFDNSPNH
jgi:NUMOD3 motif